jgi:NTP pyrophosphatase (non-canonical NTP hydrolase)
MINELAKQIHENAKAKGFYDKERNIGEMLCLIHSEVSEALEADRKNSYSPVVIQGVLAWTNDDNFSTHYKETVKGTFEEEMADIVIRVMDLCAFKGINLEGHIKAKMRYNSMREKMHGKKY